MKTLFPIVAFLFLVAPASAQWSVFKVDTTAGFRGLSVVDSKVVWASGTKGTFIKTLDGGKTWTVGQVPGAERLDFRDVEAFDADTAYLLSIGDGESSRIYKTIDGGKTWKLQHQNKNPKVFLDAFAFWDRDNGIAMGDPVDGYFYMLQTRDGGKNWWPVGNDKMFPAIAGEAAFAASGTCLVAQGKSGLWMVTGGKTSRVHVSANRGASWMAVDAPIVSGESASGIFSIAMYDSRRGIIVGGHYQRPGESLDNVAFTRDGGSTWKKASGLGGYRSGVAYIDRQTVIAVGTNGSDISRDGGKTWTGIDKENYNSVQARGRSAIWAVGPDGRLARYRMKSR